MAFDEEAQLAACNAFLEVCRRWNDSYELKGLREAIQAALEAARDATEPVHRADLHYAADALLRAAKNTRDDFGIAGALPALLERHAARLEGVARWLRARAREQEA